MLDLNIPFQVSFERATGSVGTTAQDHYWPGPPPGEVWRIGRVCLYNTHASNTLSAALGGDAGGVFHRIWGQKTLAGLDYNDEEVNGFIKEGERIRLDVFGSASSTTYEAEIQILKYKTIP